MIFLFFFFFFLIPFLFSFKMRRALADFRVSGLNTNISFLEFVFFFFFFFSLNSNHLNHFPTTQNKNRSLTRHQAFLDEDLDTGFIPRYKYVYFFFILLIFLKKLFDYFISYPISLIIQLFILSTIFYY